MFSGPPDPLLVMGPGPFTVPIERYVPLTRDDWSRILDALEEVHEDRQHYLNARARRGRSEDALSQHENLELRRVIETIRAEVGL